jgi:hypothetical protein
LAGCFRRSQRPRPNLHAAADNATGSGRPLYAVHIAAAICDFMRAHAPWDQAAALQRTALAAATQAGDTTGQAITLHELAFLSYLAGDFPATHASLTRAIALYDQAGNQRDQSIALGRLGELQYMTGDYRAAATTLEQAPVRLRLGPPRLTVLGASRCW